MTGHRKSALLQMISCGISSLFACFLLVGGLVDIAAAQNEDVVFRWASTGGGWRSMFACEGFANLFQQAGLFTEESSLFSGISTTSGASWFSTQLFYSPEYYNLTVLSSPQELYDSVIRWMNTYLVLAQNANQETELCNITRDFGDGEREEFLIQFCNILVDYGGDWALFVDDMLRAASTDYNDTGFADQLAGASNRVGALQNTDLLIQSALAPNSRTQSGTNSPWDTAVYLGPTKVPENLYAVSLSAVYVVNSAYMTTGMVYGSADLTAHTAPTPSEFSFSDWEDFYLFPGTNGTVEIENSFNTTPSGVFREAFGGSAATTAVQVASTSSAALGSFSGAIPSVFAQDASAKRSAIGNRTILLNRFDAAANRIYQNSLLYDVAVCSQWPEPCGDTDGYFIDGWFADNPAFAANIGSYQSSASESDLNNKTIKVVLTATTQQWGTFEMVQILQYFSTTFNQGIEPGEFVWMPAFVVPIRSTQIFQEYMDESMLNALLEPVEGSNMTTAILSGTTIENPAFGTKAGQSVEILLINLNENITTYIVGPALIEALTVPLAEMTRDIASNENLLATVQDFFGTSGDESTASPSTALPDNATSTTTNTPETTSSGWRLGVFGRLSILVVVLSVSFIF